MSSGSVFKSLLIMLSCRALILSAISAMLPPLLPLPPVAQVKVLCSLSFSLSCSSDFLNFRMVGCSEKLTHTRSRIAATSLSTTPYISHSAKCSVGASVLSELVVKPIILHSAHFPIGLRSNHTTQHSCLILLLSKLLSSSS